MDNCNFAANSAAVNGAGIFQEATPGNLTDCTFDGNRAEVLTSPTTLHGLSSLLHALAFLEDH